MKCITCNKEYDMEHSSREDDGQCFTCWFWTEQHEERIKYPESSVIVDGEAYWIGEEPDERTPKHCLGFGGNEWRIIFKDGRKITTHNLWSQGTIPNNFKDRLPDNARFNVYNYTTREWSEPLVDKDSCQHEWVERGDERTANFSIRCTHCGMDGLI